MNDYFEAVLDRQAPGTLAVIVQQGHIRVSYIADDLPPWYSFAPMDPRDNMTAVIEKCLDNSPALCTALLCSGYINRLCYRIDHVVLMLLMYVPTKWYPQLRNGDYPDVKISTSVKPADEWHQLRRKISGYRVRYDLKWLASSVEFFAFVASAMLDDLDVGINNAAGVFATMALLDDEYMRLKPGEGNLARFFAMIAPLPLELKARVAFASTGYDKVRGLSIDSGFFPRDLIDGAIREFYSLPSVDLSPSLRSG